ncbi:sporulation histidine kinase inhibitor Sda [Lederbergia lenta]|uniref:Sporulation inhibitor A n=1 Tax=Lederbergia lenta TaxID=1467 RepID=A0A2X4VWW7_LEDLE|nr:sporulation histidine kinase inhibitor Sda [Lederbergia lenta]MCM3111188.1 sporulation histidine kinase inhibitor Sda [Lederbergia lenta]MEC2325424.1 sporulation histidine kinase inhibitor Sda [Lederbergia lenta]SQI55321.1 Sporulation inhibitor A [Lederbergia lenta]
MKQLTNKELLHTYEKAKRLKIDQDFLLILEGELKRRDLLTVKND